MLLWIVVLIFVIPIGYYLVEMQKSKDKRSKELDRIQKRLREIDAQKKAALEKPDQNDPEEIAATSQGQDNPDKET